MECYANSDCGNKGVDPKGSYVCNIRTILWQYTQYRCDNPGTIYSKCVGKVASEVIKVCDTGDECVEGTPYCKPVRNRIRYGRRCEGKNCVILNSTQPTRYRTRKGEYYFTLNYVLSSPEGIHLTIQKPTKEKVGRFLMAGHDELVGDIRIRLSYFEGPDNYAEILIDPPQSTSTTAVTFPYYRACLPKDSIEIKGLRYDEYTNEYGPYSFKLKGIYYLDRFSISSASLYVKKARDILRMGSKEVITEITCSPKMNGSVDSLIIGVCWDTVENEPVFWLKEKT